MISARNVALLIREIDRVKRLTWFERLIERIPWFLVPRGAIGYCAICRKPIYETFTIHWDRVKH